MSGVGTGVVGSFVGTEAVGDRVTNASVGDGEIVGNDASTVISAQFLERQGS